MPADEVAAAAAAAAPEEERGRGCRGNDQGAGREQFWDGGPWTGGNLEIGGVDGESWVAIVAARK